MARLNRVEFIALAKGQQSKTIEQLAELLGFKPARIRKILSAQDDASAPQYLQDFWALWEQSEQSPKTFNKLLNDRQKTENIKAKKTDDRPEKSGEFKGKTQNVKRIKGRKFVITCAQNNTELHAPFFAALQTYCERNDAQLLISKFSYNKNGFKPSEVGDEGLWYAPEVLPFIESAPVQLAENLIFSAELNILPTVKNPLNGLSAYTGRKDCIVPHSTIALESVATAKNLDAKIMYSTGCCTLRNYIQKSAGQKAESRHSWGASIVEINDEGQHFVRQIQTDESGEFYDLDVLYSPDGAAEQATIAAITWGDIHAEKACYPVLTMCESIRNELKPSRQYIHDLQDFSTYNHHNRNDPHHAARMQADNNSLEGDFEEAITVLEDFMITPECKTYIVESNHDLALESMLKDKSVSFFDLPIEDALTYLNLQTYVYKSIKDNEPYHILPYALGYNFGSNIEFMKVDEPHEFAGISHEHHGHQGTNGARGSLTSFDKLCQKINIGHSHSANIRGGVYQAGVSGSLDMGYNKGASSWSHSHIITYKNGMRTIITLRNSDTGLQYRA